MNIIDKNPNLIYWLVVLWTGGPIADFLGYLVIYFKAVNIEIQIKLCKIPYAP
jgi:hypothetical protein